MGGSRQRLLEFRLWALVAPCVFLIAACSPLGAALKQAKSILPPPPDGDVAIAVVDSDGHVYPKKLIVRKSNYAIVWVADSDKLDLHFVGSPPAVAVTCLGPICYAGTPPAVESGRPGYEYQGTVGTGSSSRALDPHLEVVP